MPKRSRSIESAPESKVAGTPETTSAQPAAIATPNREHDSATLGPYSGQPMDQQSLAYVAAIQNLQDVLTNSGTHADHTARQVGRCVLCSCGTRVQGRLAKSSAD